MTNLEALKAKHGIQLRLLMLDQALEIATLQEKDMAVSPEAQKLITEFDDATTKIGDRIQALVAQQTAMSADDKAAFQAEVDKLNALGSDPNNPVPAA